MKIRLATLFVATALFAAACGGGVGATDGPPRATGLAEPTQPAASAPDVVTLPESGALVRLVNLYADASGPQAIDVYGFGGTEIVSEQVLVATVEYGKASAWFDPGYVKGSGDSRTVGVEIHLKGAADRLGGVRDVSVVPGSSATVIVGPSDGFGARMRLTLDSHPDAAQANVPQPVPDAGLLVTSYEGLPPADFERSVFYASVGNYCLRGTFPDPDMEEVVGHPLGQPIGNPLVVEPGSHNLTIHRGPDEAGAIPTCKDSPVAEGALQIAAGGRAYAFLYAELGKPKISLLVVPFED